MNGTYQVYKVDGHGWQWQIDVRNLFGVVPPVGRDYSNKGGAVNAARRAAIKLGIQIEEDPNSA